MGYELKGNTSDSTADFSTAPPLTRLVHIVDSMKQPGSKARAGRVAKAPAAPTGRKAVKKEVVPTKAKTIKKNSTTAATKNTVSVAPIKTATKASAKKPTKAPAPSAALTKAAVKKGAAATANEKKKTSSKIKTEKTLTANKSSKTGTKPAAAKVTSKAIQKAAAGKGRPAAQSDAKEKSPKKKRPKKEPSRFGEDWEGNSDADGSVDSALLDEDICFECGQPSTSAAWNEIILCDICDGEFHLACAQLEQPPRSGWRCSHCMDEIARFKDLKYNLPNGLFRIPQGRGCIRSLVYSPSKPLERAWLECQERGYMVVKRVITFADIKMLTHGSLELKTQRGRQASSWEGALAEVSKRLSSSCQNLTDRNGRFDLVLPNFVVEALGLNEKLEPILEKLRTVMGKRKPSIRTHNVVFAPVGSEAQPWHFDDGVRRTSGGAHRYFTILIPLNPLDDMCGGTEIWHKKSGKTDMIRPRPGDAFIFNGSLFHRGQANSGRTHRLFYYCSFSCVADENIVTS